MLTVFARLGLNIEIDKGLIWDSKKESYAREDIFSTVKICLILSSILSENQVEPLIEQLLWLEKKIGFQVLG